MAKWDLTDEKKEKYLELADKLKSEYEDALQRDRLKAVKALDELRKIYRELKDVYGVPTDETLKKCENLTYWLRVPGALDELRKLDSVKTGKKDFDIFSEDDLGKLRDELRGDSKELMQQMFDSTKTGLFGRMISDKLLVHISPLHYMITLAAEAFYYQGEKGLSQEAARLTNTADELFDLSKIPIVAEKQTYKKTETGAEKLREKGRDEKIEEETCKLFVVESIRRYKKASSAAERDAAKKKLLDYTRRLVDADPSTGEELRELIKKYRG